MRKISFAASPNQKHCKIFYTLQMREGYFKKINNILPQIINNHLSFDGMNVLHLAMQRSEINKTANYAKDRMSLLAFFGTSCIRGVTRITRLLAHQGCLRATRRTARHNFRLPRIAATRELPIFHRVNAHMCMQR